MDLVIRTVVKVGLAAVFAAVTTLIANAGHQHWSFPIVWLIWVLIVYGFHFIIVRIDDGDISTI